METANPKFHKFQLFILFLPLATLLVAFVLALLGHLVNLVVLAAVPLCCIHLRRDRLPSFTRRARRDPGPCKI